MPAYRNMGIIIRGYAERIASTVGSWVQGMADNGMAPEKIRERLKEEVETGRVIGEMRKFATAYAPGYAGEMVNRMGRDTLAATKRSEEIIAALKRKESPRERERNEEELAEIRDQLGAQGIDTEAWPEGEPLPDVPPDADLEAKFYWVAIHDKNTCPVCDENSERGALTLSEWVDLGEPRSGACYGEQNCRCVLVPADDLPEGGIPGSIEIPKDPQSKEREVPLEEVPAQPEEYETVYVRYDAEDYGMQDELPLSRVWVDGEPTDDTLRGTSVLTLEQDAMSGAQYKGLGRRYYVTGESEGYGEDPGEVLLSNARVIGGDIPKKKR